jgi:putative endonuclease
MQYVYVLQSKADKDLYIGCTCDLKKRLILHNAKKVSSTKKRAPFLLIYYETYINQKDAFNREQYLKTGWGRNYIKKILTNYFSEQETFL